MSHEDERHARALSRYKIRVAPPTIPGTRCKYCKKQAITMTKVRGPLVNFHIPTCGCCYPRLGIEFICQKVMGISTVDSVKVDFRSVEAVEDRAQPPAESEVIHLVHSSSTGDCTGFTLSKYKGENKLLSFPPKTGPPTTTTGNT